MVLAPPWDAYMRLQCSLDNNIEINNRSWGLEAALDAILAGATPRVSSVPALDLGKTVATAERRERHRARLRRTYPSALWPVVDQPPAIEARVEVEQIRQLLHPSDWHLISNVAMGTDYRAIAKDLGATPSGLRVRVTRIRNRLPLAA